MEKTTTLSNGIIAFNQLTHTGMVQMGYIYQSPLGYHFIDELYCDGLTILIHNNLEYLMGYVNEYYH